MIDLPPPSEDGACLARDWLDGPDKPAAKTALSVERADYKAMVGHQAAWAALVERAMDANVFLEPAFALPLMQHVASVRRPGFLLVWEDNGPAAFERLIGLLPLSPRRPLSIAGIARGFRQEQVGLGLPLLDRDRGAEAFDAILEWLRENDPTAAALLLSRIPRDSAFCAMAMERLGDAGHDFRILGEHRRAVLRRSAALDGATVTQLGSAKRRKELRRQRRRLTELGTRTYSSARTPFEIARATERFLALEHDGWKGKRGTALLANPSLATFTRSMTRLMALEGKCRIDSIEIDGRPVAMGIVITCGDRAHFWKTCFDETHASLSPGVQFAAELTDAQLADASVTMTDSCAVPDHPMIDRVWSERMIVVDLMVGVKPAEPRRFERVYRVERFMRAVRVKAKAWHGRLRPS